LVAVRHSLDFRRDTFDVGRIRNHDENDLSAFPRFGRIRGNIGAADD
jgi:hypothetical protein